MLITDGKGIIDTEAPNFQSLMNKLEEANLQKLKIIFLLDNSFYVDSISNLSKAINQLVPPKDINPNFSEISEIKEDAQDEMLDLINNFD